MNSYIIYGQDGEIIPEEIMKCFELAPDDYKYDKKNKCYTYDFVGFVFKNEKILAVFPKHFFSNSDIERYNCTDIVLEKEIQLLYKSIIKYSYETKKASAYTYIGEEDNYYSDYPFHAFYEIYKYYSKFGLYKSQEESIQPGTYGKVSWKKTLQKSQVIVSGGNIIYSPLYIKKNSVYANFVTECMAYIIDYTIKTFSYFISLPRVMYERVGFSYLENIDFVLRKLYEIRRTTYKDISKGLIDNIILFFKEYKAKCFGGNWHIKVNYFNHVWENAVSDYLNSYFKGIDKKTNSIIFDMTQKRSSVEFKKVSYLVDESGHQFEIELDHYGVDDKKLYIFDSKYYQCLKLLNYKQYAYDEILRYSNPKIEEMHSALLLPGKKPAEIHFQLKKEYQGSRKFGNVITEQYLSVKDVLKRYVQKDNS